MPTERQLPGEKPPIIMQPRLRYFFCAYCGASACTFSWNVKYCPKEKCQARKGEIALEKKHKYDKKRGKL